MVYKDAEPQVVTCNSLEAVVSTGAGLFLCETSDNTPPIAKSLLPRVDEELLPADFGWSKDHRVATSW